MLFWKALVYGHDFRLGRNSCPEIAFLTFSLDCIMSLSRYIFYFYVVSALQLLSIKDGTIIPRVEERDNLKAL